MFNIRILAIGTLKEPHWKRAADEYVKRLAPYAKIAFTEIPEERFKTPSDRERVQEREAQKLLKHLRQGDVVLALDERGTEMSSQTFAGFLEKESLQGDRIVFVLGGPLGLSGSILARARYRLSLSHMTFPHQMARVILLEQIYRAGTIVRGKQYHY